MWEDNQGVDWQDEGLMIQHGEHIEEHKSAEEDDMHSMHDESFVEYQLEAHVEPMTKEDEQPSYGPAIDEEQTNAHAVGRVAILSRSSPLQEYINRACNTAFPLLTIIDIRERGRIS